MARNRKYQTTATRFAPALRAFLLCALIGGSGVGYVWQKSRIDGLSKQIKEREQKLGALEASNEKLRKQLATLRSPAQLDRRVKELNLGLAPASPNQVWRLTEPVPDPQVELPAAVQYAAGAASAAP